MSEFRIVYEDSEWVVQRKVECRQNWWQKLLDAKPSECWQTLGRSSFLSSAKEQLNHLKRAEEEGVVIA